MDRDRRDPRDGHRGQGLVEFALVLPVFALAVFGLLDVGRLVYANSVLSQAAREGARLAATEAGWIDVTFDPDCVDHPSGVTSANPGAHVCPQNVSAFKDHVVSAVNRMAVSLGTISAVYVSCNDGSALDPIPSGAWTEASGGNGCHDGSGNAVSASGDQVSVRVEYTYQPMTPIISSIFASVPLSGSASMVIN